MVDYWKQYLQDLRNEGIEPSEILADIHRLIDTEKREEGEIHSLTERIHILQAATMHLFFSEGVAEEIMDWSIEMLSLLEEEDERSVHFVLEQEAAGKSMKWVVKHHDKLLSEVELKKQSENHFLSRVKVMLQRLIGVWKSIREQHDQRNKERIDPLISAITHELEHLLQ